MSHITTKPIAWQVYRLMCECGGEFEHKFNISYADKPRTHVCNKCSELEAHEDVYPKTVWEEVC